MATLPHDVLKAHAAAFEREGLPFMIVGAFAVMAHGLPRSSGDIDIVVHLPFSERERVTKILRSLGHTEFEERKDEWGQRVVGRLPDGLEVEVFFTPHNAVYDREFERRVFVDVGGTRVPFISPEDLILRKLVNTRLRRGLDYDDVVGIIAVQGTTLDLTAVRGRCAVYRVCELLERAIKDAAAATPP